MTLVWIRKIKKHPLFIATFYLAFFTLSGMFVWQLLQLDLDAAPSLEKTKTEFSNVLAYAPDWHPVNELKSKNQLTIKNVRQKFIINQSLAQNDSYFDKILSTNGWRKKNVEHIKGGTKKIIYCKLEYDAIIEISPDLKPPKFIYFWVVWNPAPAAKSGCSD